VPVPETEAGPGGEQALGVRMPGIGEHDASRCLLDDLPEIHHGDPVADRADRGEVMGDQQQRQAE
jgi:hypothetical protein